MATMRGLARTSARAMALLLMGAVALSAGGCRRYAPVHATGQGMASSSGGAIITPPPAQTTLDWPVDSIGAEGSFAPPAHSTSAAQRRLMTKLGAIKIAQRNLVEKLENVRLSSKACVRDFMLESPEVRTACKNLVRDAHIDEDREHADGSITVVLTVDLAPLKKVIRGGPRPAAPRPAEGVRGGGQARFMALEEARIDAQRQLVEAVYGAHLSNPSGTVDYELLDDRVKSHAMGFLSGAETTSQSYDPETGKATVEMSLTGEQVERLVRAMH